MIQTQISALKSMKIISLLEPFFNNYFKYTFKLENNFRLSEYLLRYYRQVPQTSHPAFPGVTAVQIVLTEVH